MSDSERGAEYHARVAAERARERLVLSRAEGVLGLALLVTTLFAWENHPRVVADPGHPGMVIAREVRHTIGLATMPAGAITIALALATLLWSSRLRSGRALVGWVSWARALVTFGVLAAELVQLLLGRRNWQQHHTAIANPALAHAVGAGVWLALGVALALVVVSSAYLLGVYGSWRDRTVAPATSRL